MKTKMIVSLVFLAGAISAQKEIKFESGTFESVLEKARKEKKMVFVDAYATWCGPCKRMERDVFTDPEAARFFNTHFINFRIDMESEAGETFQIKYPVEAYPTLMFIDGGGALKIKRTGYRNTAELISLGNRALHPDIDPLAAHRKKFAAGERSVDFIYTYIDAALEEDVPVAPIGEAFLKQTGTSDLYRDTVFSIFSLCDNTLSSPHMNYFSANLSHFFYLYGDRAVKQKLSAVFEAQVKAIRAASDKQKAYNELIVFIRKCVPPTETKEVILGVNTELSEDNPELQIKYQ